jgi:GNAT superfamily N-acetyltransferase
MIDPLVRRATVMDAVSLQALEREARQGVATARGGTRWLDEHAEIGEDWAAAVTDRAVFVAELVDPAATDGGGHVVGYLVLDLAAGIAHVDQVFVTPDARQLGFGDALLEAAEQEARRAGARVLEGHALPGDRDTKNLYERAGITARLITVSRPLR